MKGWISLHRKLLDSQMYKNLNSKQINVMLVCLLLANHEPNEWEWGSEMFKCNRGQFITSLESLRQYCGRGMKVQSVRTSLLKLQKWGFLTNKSTKTGRLITILKYDIYQDTEKKTNKDTNKQPTKSQQRANKELTTNNNYNNDNKEIHCAKAQEFSSKEYINSLIGNKRKDLHIIGIFWKHKEKKFDNKEQVSSQLKRHLKSANNLKGYSDEQILAVFDEIDKESDYDKKYVWSLETIHKRLGNK